ncbi:MAG: GMC family oxidoreductase [Candidatus Nanopelagicales bacterium]
MRIVICGAGTSGCVAAARLSEDPAHEVTLVEVGPHYRPGEWPEVLAHSHRIIKESHDWGYQARAGASPRLVHVPRGRVVGGSSVTNGAIALRGHPEHYDEWDALVDGWGWESWLPWFRAIEADRDFGGDAWHGDAGPIPIGRYPRPWMELQERFAEAALAAGHGWVDDHNRPGAVGIGPIPLNMVDGRRQTPADHYLDPALSRPNLTLRTGLVVDRVTVSGDRADGVVVTGPDGPEALPADAVVMALGTYATPAALLRSGIGPAEELGRHGIPVVAAVPGVGRGMQDHPKVSYRFELGLEAPPWPNPWYQCLLTGAHEVGGERRVYQVMPYSGQVDGGQRFTDLNVQVADARSRRGAVRLQGTDPALQPVIEMGWFLDPSDRAAAVEAGRRLMEVARQPSLTAVLTPWPGLDDPDQVLRTVETFHHPVGSCRMGRPDDPDAVVDDAGRLRGVEGVWVMDASVMARVPSANTHLAVIAMAERLCAGFTGRGGPPPAPAGEPGTT